jgi:membrane protein
VDRIVRWVNESYPAAVVRRFFDLELLDRSFGLAAQAFVALLPLVIVLVTVIVEKPDEVIAGSISDRFGLDTPARTAMQLLFQAPTSVKTISWLAIVLSFLSAWALSRRLSRVYASIFGLPSLKRKQTWRGLVWIVLQVVLFVLASSLRAVRRDGGPVLAVVAVLVLLAVWFLADAAGLRLLVPSVPRHLLVPTAIVAGVGRIGLTIWASIYMPKALSQNSEQYGPIGVTFVFFTFLLAGVLVYVGAPLLVSVWEQRRSGSTGEVAASE